MATRLFRANGEPTLSREQRRMLRECERDIALLDQAHGELVVALARADADLCVAASRRLLAIGLLLGGHARHATGKAA